jgi:protein gp37
VPLEKADWHIYQVLTKCSSLMQKFINDRYKARPAPTHMWFGVSVENKQATSRIAHLQKTNASIRFLSIEPLIAPVGKVSLTGIAWVIVGGESGYGARPMKPEWVIDIRNQCVKAKVAFSPKTGGRLLEGKEWSQFPMKLSASRQQLELKVGA